MSNVGGRRRAPEYPPKPRARTCAHRRSGDRASCGPSSRNCRGSRVPENPPSIRLGGRQSEPVPVRAAGAGHRRTLRLAPGFEAECARFRSSRTSRHRPADHEPAGVGRDRSRRVAALGVTVDQVEAALYSRTARARSRRSSRPTTSTRSSCRWRRSTSRIRRRSRCSTCARRAEADAARRRWSQTQQTVGPQTVNHTGQLPSVTLSFNLGPACARRRGVGRCSRRRARRCQATIASSFQGTRRRSSRARPGLVLILAIFVIYVVLGMLYESFIHPITILSGLPSAAFGALLTLIVFDRTSTSTPSSASSCWSVSSRRTRS